MPCPPHAFEAYILQDMGTLNNRDLWDQTKKISLIIWFVDAAVDAGLRR